MSVANYSLFSLAKDLGVSEKKILSFSHQNVRERLAAMILMLVDSHGVELEEGGILIKIDLSREDMASLLGMAPEILIRCLSEFKDEKSVRLEKKMIIVIDLTKIHKLANEAVIL